MKALIADIGIRTPDIEIETLERAGFTVKVATCRTEQDIIDAGADADAILVQYTPMTVRLFEALPALRMVSRCGIGVDNIDLKAAERHGVWVSNVPVYGHDEVPTHAIALLLSLLRHVTFHDRNVRAGTWDVQATGPMDSLSEMTLGIVGMGRLGRFVLKLAGPFFARVVAYDPFVAPEYWPDGVERLSPEELFAQSHAITLHLPLTSDNQNMVGADLLSRISERGAYLVNTSRGGLIDLDAALAALDKGALRGLGLDVLPVEPPPKDHPILHHPRTIVTPHAAWYSTSSVRDLRRRYAENVAQWAMEGTAPNVVVRGRA